ncbi:MAG: hypothetical protein JXP34_12045, partial [Planctomycetes bacterium]|nr:hypothetical protein [Planctomycetota bacterium]
FDTLCNLEMVDLEAVVREEDKERLRRLIEAHVEWTGSRLGRRILESWRDVLPYFVKVFPIDYRRALERIRDAQLDPFETTPATEEVYRG